VLGPNSLLDLNFRLILYCHILSLKRILKGGTDRWLYEDFGALQMLQIDLGENKVYYRPNCQKIQNFRVFSEYFFQNEVKKDRLP
jgi:hypothetical protein